MTGDELSDLVRVRYRQLRPAGRLLNGLQKAGQPPLLVLRCGPCGAKLGEVWRTQLGLLFTGHQPTPPTHPGGRSLTPEEIGHAKRTQPRYRWPRGQRQDMIDLIDQDYGPHPQLLVGCRSHGTAVVPPEAIRQAVRANRKVLPVHVGTALNG